MEVFDAVVSVKNGLRDRAGSLTVGTAMAVVAFCSGFISYTHISALTLHVGQSWKTAHLMPFCVDGQIVIGSAYFMYGTNWKSKAAGLVFGVVPGIAESLIANWESGIVHGLFAAGWATVPAQAFACSTILFERWLHARRQSRPGVTEGQLQGPALPPAVNPEPSEPAAPGPEEARTHAAPHQEAPQGPATPAAAPVLPPGQPVAGPVANGLPLPLLPSGPVSQWPPARPKTVPSARPAVRRERQAGDRPPLPEGTELAAVLTTLSDRQMAAAYDVTKYAANKMKNDYRNGDLVIGAAGEDTPEEAPREEVNGYAAV